MSKIEEVKKILEHQPDKGRLLTDEEINEIANAIDVSEYPTSVDYWEAIIQAELKAQRDLTASIKDAVYVKLRRLTKKEMIKINDAQPSEAKYGDVFGAIADEQLSLIKQELQEQGFDVEIVD